jgi:hypothetical protein
LSGRGMMYLSLRKTRGGKHAEHGNRRAGDGGGTVRAQSQKANGIGGTTLHGGTLGRFY